MGSTRTAPPSLATRTRWWTLKIAAVPTTRRAQIEAFQARRTKHSATMLDLDRRQAQQEQQKSELAATLASARRKEDALVLVELAAQAQWEGDLKEQTVRSSSSQRSTATGAASSSQPAPALSGPPSVQSPPRVCSSTAAPTYAAAAASSPTTRSASARSSLLVFEPGDRSFSPAKLSDVAQAVHFNCAEGDRRLFMEVAAAAAIAVPAGFTIQDAVTTANDLARIIAASSARQATEHASSPVVWPSCGGAMSEADAGFAVSKAGRSKSKQAHRSGKVSGSSGDESGWSSAGTSRHH
ncbi:unnamed protein product [Ectocarpus sp. CCAP 1310/34]|nr:unnamed protein product [Ectocarpus sp. CCAP 1310/34]